MAKFLTEIQFVSTSSMETPEPGFVTVYMNTNGYLYAKFPNGEQARLS
jgi:hypothetical protein